MTFEQLASFFGFSTAVVLIFLLITIWEGVWKGIALWKSGRHKQLGWFICLLVINTAGILPIIYILFFQKKRAVVKNKPRRKRR